MTGEVYSATIAMRSYFSSSHLLAAKLHAKAAEDIEAKNSPPKFVPEQRAFVASSVLAAVAFLEGAINEFLKDIAEDHQIHTGLTEQAKQNITIFWDEFEGKGRSSFSILPKYNTALIFCGFETFDRGTNPYQDADHLIKLRNALMHFKPETVSPTDPQQFKAQIGSKFASNPLLAGLGNPYFPDHCLGSPCANWAIQTARNFADAFFAKIGKKPNYQLLGI